MTSALAAHWSIDPSVTFLNHGSFGATPREIQDAQSELRAHLEENAMQFFLRDLESLLDESRAALAAFVSARPRDLAFVPNATTGVNAVVRSLKFSAGDELLTTDHTYNACKNALEFVAAPAGARVTIAHVPFPLSSEDEVVSAIAEKITPRTRLLLIDHVTSPTGLVFPLARIAKEASARGVDVLVDGAHAPGMIDVSLDALAPHVAYYTANCHKWLCAPKGSAFLWVREDKQNEVRPTVISHGANARREDRSRFLMEFDWTGTIDPTPALLVGASIDFLKKLDPNFQKTNRALALEARKILCDALSVAPPAPESMIGSLAAVQIPDGKPPTRKLPFFIADELQQDLFDAHKIEVPIFAWPAPPKRLVRVSAHLYNAREEYEKLARALVPIDRASPRGRAR